jgi:Ca2+-binding RTX toxin-like protein
MAGGGNASILASIAQWLNWLTPINNVIAGESKNDTLSAAADGDVVDGGSGNDKLTSGFNRTALIGGSGKDDLRTEAILRLQDGATHGVAVQTGDAGDDSLVVAP